MPPFTYIFVNGDVTCVKQQSLSYVQMKVVVTLTDDFVWYSIDLQLVVLFSCTSLFLQIRNRFYRDCFNTLRSEANAKLIRHFHI